MRLVLGLICVLMLCACGTEPEDREFVTAVALSGEYELSVLTAEGKIGEETDEKNESIVSAEGKSIREAVDKCNIATAGELFFGHTTVCIVNTRLLEDGKAVRELTEYVTDEAQISRRVVLLASDNPDRVLNGKSGDGDVADFVKEYYKTHDNKSPTELDKLCRAIAENGDAVLPMISYASDFELDGAVVMSNGVLVKKLTSEEYEGVAWLLRDNTPNIVTAVNGDEIISAEIRDKTFKVYPEEIDIRVRLEAEGDNNESLTEVELNKLEGRIKAEAEEGLAILREYGCDVVGMKHTLEKSGIDKITDVLDGVEVNVFVVYKPIGFG